MGFYKQVNKIHRQTLTDGKKIFTIEVPITVEYWHINDQMEEVLPCEEMRKIELAIEAKCPGWFHTCFEKRKQHCKACSR